MVTSMRRVLLVLALAPSVSLGFSVTTSSTVHRRRQSAVLSMGLMPGDVKQEAEWPGHPDWSNNDNGPKIRDRTAGAGRIKDTTRTPSNPATARYNAKMNSKQQQQQQHGAYPPSWSNLAYPPEDTRHVPTELAPPRSPQASGLEAGAAAAAAAPPPALQSDHTNVDMEVAAAEAAAAAAAATAAAAAAKAEVLAAKAAAVSASLSGHDGPMPGDLKEPAIPKQRRWQPEDDGTVCSQPAATAAAAAAPTSSSARPRESLAVNGGLLPEEVNRRPRVPAAQASSLSSSPSSPSSSRPRDSLAVNGGLLPEEVNRQPRAPAASSSPQPPLDPGGEGPHPLDAMRGDVPSGLEAVMPGDIKKDSEWAGHPGWSNFNDQPLGSGALRTTGPRQSKENPATARRKRRGKPPPTTFDASGQHWSNSDRIDGVKKIAGAASRSVVSKATTTPPNPNPNKYGPRPTRHPSNSSPNNYGPRHNGFLSEAVAPVPASSATSSPGKFGPRHTAPAPAAKAAAPAAAVSYGAAMPGDIRGSGVTMPGWPSQSQTHEPERSTLVSGPRERAAEKRKSLTVSAPAPPVVSGSMASPSWRAERQGGDGHHKEYRSKLEGESAPTAAAHSAPTDSAPTDLPPKPSPSTSRKSARLEADQLEAAAVEKHQVEQEAAAANKATPREVVERLDVERQAAKERAAAEAARIEAERFEAVEERGATKAARKEAAAAAAAAPASPHRRARAPGSSSGHGSGNMEVGAYLTSISKSLKVRWELPALE